MINTKQNIFDFFKELDNHFMYEKNVQEIKVKYFEEIYHYLNSKVILGDLSEDFKNELMSFFEKVISIE